MTWVFLSFQNALADSESPPILTHFQVMLWALRSNCLKACQEATWMACACEVQIGASQYLASSLSNVLLWHSLLYKERYFSLGLDEGWCLRVENQHWIHGQLASIGTQHVLCFIEWLESYPAGCRICWKQRSSTKKLARRSVSVCLCLCLCFSEGLEFAAAPNQHLESWADFAWKLYRFDACFWDSIIVDQPVSLFIKTHNQLY